MIRLRDDVKTEKDTEKSLPFLKQTPNTNLILLVEDQKLFVNKTILTFASPVWAKMLTADFKEKDSSEIQLPDKKAPDVVAFLRCVYPDIIDEIDNENVYQVLPLAEEYQCSKLKEKCENYLVNFLSKNTEIQLAFKSLLTSCTYGLKKAIEASADVLCDRSLSTLEKNKLWKVIPDKGKYMVCMKRTLLLDGSVRRIKDTLKSAQEMVYCDNCKNGKRITLNKTCSDFVRDEINSTNKTN